MKKTVKNRIARETLSRVLGHSVLSAVLVLGWNVSTVFAISPSSGIEQVIGVTNTVTAAPTYTITNDDYKAVLYARSTAGNVAALNVNGDVNVTYIQPTSSLHDNYGTLIFVTGTGTDLSSVKVDGDVNFNVSGLAYSDIWIESANTTIDIAGKLTGVSDSRNSVVMARQGTVNIGSVDVTVTSDPDNKNNVAIWLQDGATVNVAGEIKLDTQGQWGKGIWANGALGATTLTAGAIDIKTKVQAISVLNQSTVTVDGLVKVVKNSTSDSDVVGSSSGGSITAGSFDIVVNDALTNERALSAFGDDSTINCLGTAKIVINKNAGDTGSSVSAVLAGARGEITLGSLDAELDTKYSRGINVLSNNTDSKETLVTVNGAAKIMMKGEGSYGIIAQSGKSKIMLQDVQVTTTGNYSYGISSGGIVEANNVVLNGSGIQAFGVHAAGGDGTVILKNLWADMAGQASRGVYAQNGGSITADYVDIKTTGIGSAALAVTNIGTIPQSAITIGGGYVSSADSSSAALRLYSDADAGANNPVINLTNVQAEGVNGSRLILSSGFSTLNAASSILTGNVYANDTGTNGRFTFNMDASELNGSVFSSSSTVDIDLTMDNNSRWNIAGGVSVNNLHCLDNRNGIVDMSSKSNGYETLMIDSLKGTGTYIFDTDLSSEIYGDKISIVTSEVGNNLVQVKDASLINGEVTGVKNLLIITDASQNATFVGSALNSGGLWDVTPTIERGDVALDAVGN
ncbi:pertactin-like passenger domain-containing protein, partial [Phascolarctobacterium faecium]